MLRNGVMEAGLGAKLGGTQRARGRRVWGTAVVREAEAGPQTVSLPTYLKLGPHCGALAWHHFSTQPLASALAQGLLEKMSQQCAYWCCVCGGGAVRGRGISASPLFPRHGKERGRHHPPDPSAEGAGHGGQGRSYSPDQRLGNVLRSWGQDGQGASSALLWVLRGCSHPAHCHTHPHAMTPSGTCSLLYNSYSTGWEAEPLGPSPSLEIPCPSLALTLTSVQRGVRISHLPGPFMP